MYALFDILLQCLPVTSSFCVYSPMFPPHTAAFNHCQSLLHEQLKTEGHVSLSIFLFALAHSHALSRAFLLVPLVFFSFFDLGFRLRDICAFEWRCIVSHVVVTFFLHLLLSPYLSLSPCPCPLSLLSSSLSSSFLFTPQLWSSSVSR